MADEIKAVVKEASGIGAWVKKAIQDAWGWVTAWTQFLDGPDGKFSHKRLIAVACTAVAIRQFIKVDLTAGVILLGAAVILAIVSAITKT